MNRFNLLFILTLALLANQSFSADFPPQDHGGANLTLSNGDRIWGVHTNIGTFTINIGVTATVRAFEVAVTGSGFVEVNAVNAEVHGTLDATSAGHEGGSGGGAGGGSAFNTFFGSSGGVGGSGGTISRDGNGGGNGSSGTDGGFAGGNGAGGSARRRQRRAKRQSVVATDQSQTQLRYCLANRHRPPVEPKNVLKALPPPAPPPLPPS